MKPQASARLAKVLTHVVEIERARHGQLLAELSDVGKSYVGAVDALSDPGSCCPALLAAMSCRSLEAQLMKLSKECECAAQKLIDDRRQQKLFEARAWHEREQELAISEREQQAEIIERTTSASLR